jgi:DNA-binding NtrC family response regulator
MSENILIVEDQFLEANNLQIILERSGHRVCGIARSVDEAKEIIGKKVPDIALVDIFLKGKLTGIDLAGWLTKKDIPFIFLSANSNESTLDAAKATRPYGFLVKPFRERDILVALEIASYRHNYAKEIRSRQEQRLSELLESILNREVSQFEKAQMMAKAFQAFIPFDYFLIEMAGERKKTNIYIGLQRVEYDDYVAINDSWSFSTDNSLDNSKSIKSPYVYAAPAIFNEHDFINLSRVDNLIRNFRELHYVRSSLVLPLDPQHGIRGNIYFMKKQATGFNSDHLELLLPQLSQINRIVNNIMVQATSIENNNDLHIQDKRRANHFPGIIGKSAKLLLVLDQIAQVAPYDTSVLILGETGTGKEGLVDGIHRLSTRKLKPLIKINCSAIPAGLFESELFGHERGSYTDARERRIGKFEQAQGGTIFLDEIGEIPLDVQSKLLRVLQEKEIERVGGRSTIKVDVRIIAATNRNLYKEVADGNFRMDLYYRINVFPIDLAPLRERKEDIPLLVEYFLHRQAQVMGTRLKTVSQGAMEKLIAYSWPGNIRELQHLIERHILINKGNVINNVELPIEVVATEESTHFNEIRMQSIEEVEKAHILMVLQKCNGRISGKDGAAEILQMPPSSLSLRMKKLGIGWQHTIVER